LLAGREDDYHAGCRSCLKSKSSRAISIRR
jgi:hypothetical protein